MARHHGRLQGDRQPASGCNHHTHHRNSAPRTLQRARKALDADHQTASQSCGKDAWWKSQKNDFPTTLANPAKRAGFALSHSFYDYWLIQETGHLTSLASKTGHLYLLPTLPACLNAKSRRSTRCCEKLNSAVRLIQRTTSEAPQRPDEGNFRCHLRIVSGLAENTNSIFCDSSLELEAANGCPVLQGAGTTSRGRIFRASWRKRV